MGLFSGVWRLEKDKSIYCKKEMSGKCFQSNIAGLKVVFSFPSCPETYSNSESSLSKGDLIAPIHIFQESVNWGTIQAWPEGLFSANALICVFEGKTSDLQKIYADFPRWKEKFYNLVLIDSGDFLQPETKPISLLQHGNGVFDGLEFFTSEDDKRLVRVRNNRDLSPINLNFVTPEECYNIDKTLLLFENTGSSKEISLVYELLLAAYRAVIRHDFRSAIVLAATALEKSILDKIQSYYIDNQLTTFERDKEKHKMLGKKFSWLNELEITIPVHNYDVKILEVRNPTAHEGKNQNHSDTKEYLGNCKLIIQAYSPSVLEK